MEILNNVVKEGTMPRSGILTEQLISLYDILEEKHFPKLIARYGKQFDNMQVLFRSLGREEPISQIEYTAHEENWIHDNFKVKTNVADPGAGKSAVIPVDSDNVYGTGTSAVVYARKGDIITMPITEVQVIITNKAWNANTERYEITVKPLRSTQTVGAITAGTTLAITNGAFGAGTKNPEGTVVGTTPRNFQAQIFKESVGLEGSEFVKEKWFKYIGDGRDVVKWYTTGLARAEYLLNLKLDGAFSMGEMDDGNVTVPAGEEGAGNVVKTTRGMFPWVRDLGKEIDASEGFQLSMLDQIALYMKRQGIESSIALGLVGNVLVQSIENEAVDFLAQTGIDYTRVEKTIFKGNRELSLSVNFKTITKGGVTFMIKPYDNWSNPKTWGSTGYNLEEYGILFPLSTVKDAKSGLKMNNVGIKYLQKDGYSRRFESWSVKGAGGGLYVTDVDRADFYLRAHQMFYMVAANQGVILDPNYSSESLTESS